MAILIGMLITTLLVDIIDNNLTWTSLIRAMVLAWSLFLLFG